MAACLFLSLGCFDSCDMKKMKHVSYLPDIFYLKVKQYLNYINLDIRNLHELILTGVLFWDVKARFYIILGCYDYSIYLCARLDRLKILSAHEQKCRLTVNGVPQYKWMIFIDCVMVIYVTFITVGPIKAISFQIKKDSRGPGT